MKTRKLSVLIFLLLVFAPQLMALEIELDALFGNLNLPWAGETAIKDSQYPLDNWLYGANFKLRETFVDGLDMDIVYATDPVLRHILKTRIIINSGWFSISTGPLVGLFPTEETPVKIGLNVGLRMDVPGIIFVDANIASSLGAQLFAVGDATIDEIDISAGWHSKNMICSASILTKKLTIIDSNNIRVSDSSERYALDMDIYQKGSIWHLILSAGYENFARIFDEDSIDRLGFVFVGTQFFVKITERLQLSAKLEGSVYSFGMDNLVGRGPAGDAFLFRSSIGGIYSFDKLVKPGS